MVTGDIEYSVVIPLFNEEGSLQSLQGELNEVMESLSCKYEIIYVNDGSKDSSAKVLEDLKRNHPNVKVISFKENKGQSAALLAGFKASQGKWIFTLDADGQNPPKEFLKLLEFKDKFDFITGIREKRKDVFLKKTSSAVAKLIRWIVLHDTTKDTGCSLRIFKREAIDYSLYFKNVHSFFTFLARIKGFSIKEVCVGHRFRVSGKSKYGYVRRAYDGVIGLGRVLLIKRHIRREA